MSQRRDRPGRGRRSTSDVVRRRELSQSRACVARRRQTKRLQETVDVAVTEPSRSLLAPSAGELRDDEDEVLVGRKELEL